jgi:isopenicillin N synthase-like dioxygenase
MMGDTLRTSVVAQVTKPNMSEAFFMARDLAADHPDVVSGRRFRSANQWPGGLPGFREPLVEYCDTLERLVQSLVRVYARALGLPATYFDGPFTDFQYKLRATHYPSQPKALDDEFGIAPHTDTSFLTLLAANDVPGLAFRTQTGDWIDVPTVPDAFIVNGGQLLLRWTNDCFLATPHRAVNRTGGERYALAFFCDAQIDWPIAAVPTCVGPLRPPRYETTYYTDYMIGYQARTYNVFDDQARDASK